MYRQESRHNRVEAAIRHPVWKFTGDMMSSPLKKNLVISSATRTCEFPVAESQKLNKPESFWTRDLLSQPHRWFALIGLWLTWTYCVDRPLKEKLRGEGDL